MSGLYLPSQFEETRPEVLQALMRSYPLGCWITVVGGELLVNHIPFIFDPQPGGQGRLRCHVARANPVWRRLADATQHVVVFQGAQSYVSPAWYPSKQEHGKVVPTWNYAVVHAQGKEARAIEDAAWLLQLLHELTDTHEAPRASDWKVSDAPADYIDKLLNAIVGIEIPVQQLSGKWKISQNRSAKDQAGVMDGLQTQPDAESLAMAALMRKGGEPS